MISESLIIELKTILFEDYGFDLETTDAEQAAFWLASYFDLVAQMTFEIKDITLDGEDRPAADDHTPHNNEDPLN